MSIDVLKRQIEDIDHLFCLLSQWLILGIGSTRTVKLSCRYLPLPYLDCLSSCLSRCKICLTEHRLIGLGLSILFSCILYPCPTLVYSLNRTISKISQSHMLCSIYISSKVLLVEYILLDWFVPLLPVPPFHLVSTIGLN